MHNLTVHHWRDIYRFSIGLLSLFFLVNLCAGFTPIYVSIWLFHRPSFIHILLLSERRAMLKYCVLPLEHFSCCCCKSHIIRSCAFFKLLITQLLMATSIYQCSLTWLDVCGWGGGIHGSNLALASNNDCNILSGGGGRFLSDINLSFSLTTSLCLSLGLALLVVFAVFSLGLRQDWWVELSR